MTEDRYNGWTNYPTWCVNLWLSNDEGLYNEAQAKAEYAVIYADDHPNIAANIWTEEETRRYVLAEDLKSWVCDDLMPDLAVTAGDFAGGLASDLIGYALGAVNWNEIADAWLVDAVEKAQL